MAYQGRYNNGNTKSSGPKVWKIVLIVVLSVVLILGLLLGAAYFYLQSKLNLVTQAQFEEKDTSGMDLSALIGNLDETEPTTSATQQTTAPTEETTIAPTEPDYGETGKVINFLVIGQDARPGEDSKLADCIIMLTLNKETRTLIMTSFLRDSYVKLPENYRGHTCGWNRVNTAYALGYSWYGDAGAMEMLDITLKDNYGVEVAGNIEVSFSTFKKVVDFLGGVEVELYGDEYTKMLEWQDIFNEHYEWNKYNKHVEINEGLTTLNGDMALEYARERHVNYGDSDIQRTGRQRKVIASMLDKVSKLNPLELNKLIDKILPTIITDISTDEMNLYIREITPYLFDGLTLVSQQIPAEGTYWGEMVTIADTEAGVLKISFDENRRIIETVMKGEVPEKTTTRE